MSMAPEDITILEIGVDTFEVFDNISRTYQVTDYEEAKNIARFLAEENGVQVWFRTLLAATDEEAQMNVLVEEE